MDAPYRYCASCSLILDPEQGFCTQCGAPAPPDPRIVAGKFILGRRLGQGGMGEVFEATVPHLGGHRVALKLLSPRLASDPDFVRRLTREARIAARLRHPNIVVIHDTSLPGQSPCWISMELLDGEVLSARLQSGALPAGDLLPMLLPALDALALAHGQGVEHRDLKPDNLFLSREADGGTRLKILDFGIAQAQAAPQRGATATLGNPLYAAPELYQEGAGVPLIPGAADVFSLGVILYEGLGGKRPFPVSTLLATQRPPRPLRALRPEVPADLSELVARMLAADPALRPALAEVIGVLSAAIQKDAGRPQPPRRRLTLVAVALALLVIGGAIWALSGKPPPPPSRDLSAQALQAMQEDLAAQKPATRLEALSAILLTRDPALAKVIAPLLLDPDAEVAARAAKTLGQIGARDTAASLRRALGPDRPLPLRIEATGALLRMGEVADLQVLRDALRAPLPHAALHAALLLGEQRDPAGLAVLRRLAGGKLSTAEARVGVQSALLRGKEEGAAAPLVASLRAEDLDERVWAAGALLQADPNHDGARQLLKELLRGTGPQQLRAARLLASFEECQDVNALLRLTLQDPARGVPDKVLAAQGLGECGELKEDGPALAAYFAKELALSHGSLRPHAAAAVLRLSGTDRGRALALCRAVLEGDAWLTSDADAALLAALLAEAPDEVLPRLRERQRDPRPEVRRRVIRVLRQGGTRTFSELAAALDDPDEQVREEARPEVLRQLRAAPGRAQQLLARRPGGSRAALADRDPFWRRVALISLPDGEAGAALQRMLKDGDRRVRVEAAERLAALGQGIGRALRVLQEARLAGGLDGLRAYVTLSRLGARPAEPKDLGQLLRESAPAARAEAVRVLAGLPAQEGLGLLRLALQDPAAEVRRAVAEGAIRILPCEPRARRLLLSLRGDPDGALRLRVAGALVAPPGRCEKGPPPKEKGPEKDKEKDKDKDKDKQVLAALAAARAAWAAGDRGAAQRLLAQVCTAGRRRELDGDCRVGRAWEQEAKGLALRAAEIYEEVILMNEAQRSAGALREAEQGMSRLKKRWGRLYLCGAAGKQVQWLPPGVHQVSVAGRRVEVRLRAGEERSVGCP